ncbi:MAG: PAS domain S-box protein [Gemmatimonadota bacterium]|nr:MAG: PAS domain S-box protein [Gemmatimonadota bacterium]
MDPSILRNVARPEDRRVRRKTIRDVFAGKNFYCLEWADCRADGSSCIVRVDTLPLRDTQGEIIMGICACNDISEQKRNEELLIRAAQEWRVPFDAMVDSVSIIDTICRIKRSNKTTTQMFGLTFGDLIHRSYYEIFHGTRSPIKNCPFQTMLTSRTSESGEFYLDNLKGWASITVDPILDAHFGIVGAVHIVRDITERKQLQKQLLQSEKMFTLGQLISGVAHELNNPMTGILGFSQLLMTSQDLPRQAQQYLSKINREAERTRGILQNLLTFARQRKPEKRMVRLNEIVNRTLELRAYEMNVSTIEVVRKFDPKIPPLLADGHQLQQVFLNIIINAEQAVLPSHDGGRLTTALHLSQHNIRARRPHYCCE